jgi:hypothetical protein
MRPILNHEGAQQKYGFKVDKATIWRWTKAGKWPKPRKVAGRNYYFEDECDAAYAAMIGERVAA